MRYTVTWRRDKKQKLARIWLASNNRQAITAAADQIDHLLRDAPESVGIDFYGDYIMAVPPLVVVYSISPKDRLVQVTEIYHESLSNE